MTLVALLSIIAISITPMEDVLSKTVYNFSAKSINGNDVPMSDYKGKVLLIVNTASQCGFTPQYEGLEKLHQDYSSRGFTVLGFPCDQFGGQEPGTESEILTFCREKYSVTFPLFTKIEVNGDRTHPLYKHLKSSIPGVLGTETIKWNFTKFLVDSSGKVVQRYAPQTEPKDIAKDIENLLK